MSLRWKHVLVIMCQVQVLSEGKGYKQGATERAGGTEQHAIYAVCFFQRFSAVLSALCMVCY